MNDCEKFKGLLMGLIDRELTPEESNEVNAHLARCAKCREEYEQLRETSGKINSLSFVEPTDEVLEKIWKSPFSRMTRNAGLVMIIGGYAALILFGLFQIIFSDDEAWFPRISIAAIIIGFLILLGHVIRERLKTFKTDPYKEIQR